MTRTRIAIVGDFDPTNETHLATDAAVEHASAGLSGSVEAGWIATPDLDASGQPDGALSAADGIWIAPGSPYRSQVGALNAITWARTRDVPLIGTCGGFQHLVIEFARNVAGIAGAAHAESDPGAARLLVTPMTCNIAGQAMAVTVEPVSRAGGAYGVAEATEQYYCRFALNPEYVGPLVAAGLAVSGVDQDGEARIVELHTHPFYVGTLFVPQVASRPLAPHPLVRGFVEAAVRHALTRVAVS